MKKLLLLFLLFPFYSFACTELIPIPVPEDTLYIAGILALLAMVVIGFVWKRKKPTSGGIRFLFVISEVLLAGIVIAVFFVYYMSTTLCIPAGTPVQPPPPPLVMPGAPDGAAVRTYINGVQVNGNGEVSPLN